MPFDPFGRLMGPIKPEPEIMNFQNPFRLGYAVGMEGINSRRDVAKVESLLGQAGALDLGKTDGVTGFFGARTDEAVRTFQKNRGLKVDGLINPSGPTLKTLAREAGATKLPSRHALAAPIDPGADPRRDTVKRIARRLLDIQKTGIDPKA